jgi:hypothetical protein
MVAFDQTLRVGQELGIAIGAGAQAAQHERSDC